MKFKAVLSFLSAVVFSAYAILPTANKIQHNSNNSFAEEYCDEIIDNTIIPEITLDSSVNVLADENEEEVALSGECGDNITWKFNEVSNTLEIDGYGKMGRWYNETPAPWYPIKDRIEKILISDEIEDVGQYAFYNCANLKSVSLPESITRIDPYCFYMCPLLSDVVIPDNVWYR